MSAAATSPPDATESTDATDRPEGATGEHRRSFVRWGGGSYLVATVALLVVSGRQTAGEIVYLIDDPAIHLSLAQNLVHHGTWGVVPGQFQSASSSPLWTVLMGGFVGVAGGLRRLGLPLSDSTGPLLLNMAAALWIIWILGGEQRVLLPSWRRPLDALAVMGLVVFVLFLPALTLLGMEHTLQIALVLSAVVLFGRMASGRPLGCPRSMPYLVLALAALVRFETLFVAGGIAMAFMAQCVPGWSPSAPPPPLMRQCRRTIAVCLAAGLPVLAFSVFNRSMGQGWLPNSVLAKGHGLTGGADNPFQVTSILNRLTTDPIVAFMAVVACGALIVSWRQRRRYTFVTIVFIVTTSGQVLFAQIGWFERYQAYIVALGILVLLAIADETVPASRRAPQRAFLVPGLAILSLLLCATKTSLTLEVPRAVQDSYQQRYQAGRFLDQYYDEQPVATGELGYISLHHRGPITDLFGLGDYEVLQARRSSGQNPGKEYWAALADSRGFKVAAVYPSTLFFNTPDNWILVGEWHMDHAPVTALEPTFQFWATTPDEVAPLEAHLRAFEAEMPPGATLTINPLAGFRAAALGEAH